MMIHDPTLSRRLFLRNAGAVGALALASPSGARVDRAPTALPSFPQHDPARVSAIVGAAHGNADAVRSLLLEQPALAKASWDWGFGDWETPLGAASHVGRRDIAELLLAHGARPTIFSAAMMGDVDTVRAFLSADPGLFRLHGPHGISLVRHAEAGGADASVVVEYLTERFGPDPVPFGVAADAGSEARYEGRFRFDGDPEVILVTGAANGWLGIGSGARPTGRLLPVDGEIDVFYPAGAPAVRIRFLVEEGRTVRLTVEDGPFRGTGTRLPS